MRRGNGDVGLLAGIAIVATAVLIAVGMWGMPKYKIYSQRLRGEASLREAEWDRKIEVEAAKARLEATRLQKQSTIVQAEGLSEAEVIRANGAAEANEIIADGLGGPEGYLRYLWIQGLQDGSSEVIYIATEAGLPILEAGRRLGK